MPRWFRTEVRNERREEPTLQQAEASSPTLRASRELSIVRIDNIELRFSRNETCLKTRLVRKSRINRVDNQSRARVALGFVVLTWERPDADLIIDMITMGALVQMGG